MALKFQPKTEEQLNSFENLPAGEYPFTILESEEVASKSAKNPGKLMAKIKLNVHGPNGDRHVYDYFADWFSEWKLKHFLETTGFGAEYAKGEADPSGGAWRQRQGYVKLEVEPAQGNFAAKNVVADYVVKGEAKAASPNTPPEDDSVPF